VRTRRIIPFECSYSKDPAWRQASGRQVAGGILRASFTIGSLTRVSSFPGCGIRAGLAGLNRTAFTLADTHGAFNRSLLLLQVTVITTGFLP
jgi:hypothetical protein